jgi:hypothetical protein
MTLVSPNLGYPLEKLEGNPGTMGDWSRSILDVAEELEELRTGAYATSDITGSGSAMVAVRADARTLAGAIAPDIVLAEQVARALRTYADAFRTTAERANALIDDIEAAHRAWKDASAEAERAGLDALWSSRAGDDDAADTNADAREAVAGRDSAKAALDDLWAEYEGHYSAWDEAYDAALADLAGGGSAVLTTQARDFLTDLLAAASPDEVLRLWQENPSLRQELIDSHPEIIGNLDGVPWDVRATVNESRLEDLLETEPEGRRRDELEAIWRAIQTGGEPIPHLISFDPAGSEQVTAALAYGDLATASEINSLIPGMHSNVADMQAWGESAKSLNASIGDGSATVVWFGYDSPDLLEEPGMSRAEDGAAALSSYLRAVRALSPAAEVNVIAHSYGSTTAALAIGSQPDGLGVTSFIAVGSAGFPDDPTVVENLTNGQPPQIYATISEDDAIARIGRGTAPNHPVSPETLPGTTVFDSDGGVSSSGESLPAATGHDALGPGAYLEPGSESFYNVSEIIQTGQPGTERGGTGSTQGFWDSGNWWISDEYAVIDF